MITVVNNRDSKGNEYIDLNNLRITYVNASTRRVDSNWSASDVIRIQAYKDPVQRRALHKGAEMPVTGELDLIDLAMAILEMARHRMEK